MKLKELSEMTQRFKKVGSNLSDTLDYVYGDKDNYKHVGDINKANVLYKDDIYLLILDDIPLGFFQVFNKGNTALVQNMYIVLKFRKQGWMSMFLFFLKQNESYDRIQLGSQHSDDTVEAVKRISNRFDIYWEKDGKKVPYDPDNLDDFYGIHETGWNIILENNGDFSKFPKFWNHDTILQDLRIQYDRLLD